MSERSKYHHLVPRAYLRSWCFSKDSIYWFPKNDISRGDHLNINNHFGINYYHSIQAGMPICTYEDIEKIFEPLNGYRVEYNGKILSLKEYNQYYYDFQEWMLFYVKNGARVAKARKNEIMNKIKQFKILDIEEGWNIKYEDGWNKLLNKIESEVSNARFHIIEPFYKGKLIKFIVSLNWRSYHSNESLNKMMSFFDNIVGFSNVPMLDEEGQDKTFYDWMRHNLLLEKFREFLVEKGSIFEIAKKYIKYMKVKFYVSDSDYQFITSDNPSFEHNGIHIMPLSPRILVQLEPSSDMYFYNIEYLNKSRLKYYNSLIINNSNEKILSNKNIIHFDKSMLS